MAMFSPFGPAKTAGVKPGEEAKKPEAAKSADKPAGQGNEIAELKAQLANIQSKLEKLSDDR